MQGAHEHRHPPERNAAAEQPLAQLCEHLVSLHRRSRAIDEPIHSRPYVASRHQLAFVCELRWTLIVAHSRSETSTRLSAFGAKRTLSRSHRPARLGQEWWACARWLRSWALPDPRARYPRGSQ